MSDTNAHASGTQVAGARVLSTPPRAALLALVPLGVIAVGFITPPIIPHALWPYRSVQFISPYEDGTSWMWSIQIVAVLLAALTFVHARRRDEPGVTTKVIAVLGTLAVLHLPIVMLIAVGAEIWPLSLTSAIVVAGTLVALAEAWRRPGWQGWLWVLGAYALAALPYACPLFPGIFNVFSGGLTFAAADVTLLALVVMGLRHQQRR